MRPNGSIPKLSAWSFLEDNGFSLIFAVGNSLELRIQKVDDFAPLTSTVFGWQVDNIEEAVTTLSAKGVQFEQIGLPTQDELGINTFNDEVKVAWFKGPRRQHPQPHASDRRQPCLIYERLLNRRHPRRTCFTD